MNTELEEYLCRLSQVLPGYKREEIFLELRNHLEDAISELSREHTIEEATTIAIERFGYKDDLEPLAKEFRKVYHKDLLTSTIRQFVFYGVTLALAVIILYLLENRLLLLFDLPSLLLVLGGSFLITVINYSQTELLNLWHHITQKGCADNLPQLEILHDIKLIKQIQEYTIQVGWLVSVIRLIFLFSSRRELLFENIGESLIPTFIPLLYAHVLSLFVFNLAASYLQRKVDHKDKQ